MTTQYKLGDTVRVWQQPEVDASEDSRVKELRRVLCFLTTGEMVDDCPPRLVTLTTQEMVDKYNQTGQT